MSCRHIIPCLHTRDGRLVKGVNFVNVKELRDLAESAKAYSDEGADELMFMDITASKEGRRTFLKAVERTVAVISVPLTVGGGVASIEDVRRLLDMGVSRASINTAAALRPELVQEAAEEFGRNRVTVAIDARRNATMASGYEVVIRDGTQGTGMDAVEWAKRCEMLGAGTIVPVSMDRDGTKAGYDIPMTKAIAQAVTVPVLASGGAGKLEDLYEALAVAHADAVLVASIAHFGVFTILQMKEYLHSQGIAVSLGYRKAS